jgi:hypothetical protein
VTLETWLPFEPCRDEACRREELHASHGETALKGRTPKQCPRCLGPLEDARCSGCGWFRLNGTRLSATPWVLCNPCPGQGCAWCGGTGVLPRIRSVAVRSMTPRAEVAEELAEGSALPEVPRHAPRETARRGDWRGDIGRMSPSSFALVAYARPRGTPAVARARRHRR